MSTANPSLKMLEEDWDMFKEHLRVMYLGQNTSIKAIRDHMITAYHFDRSRQQYERKFAKWGFRKNCSQQEWRTVDLQLKRQFTATDDAKVELNGRVINTKRLKKALSRSVVTTLADKWLPNSKTSLSDYTLNNSSRSVVPDCSALIVRSTANYRIQFQPATHIPLFEFWTQGVKYLTQLLKHQNHISRDSVMLSRSESFIDSRLGLDTGIFDENGDYNDHARRYVASGQGHSDLDILRPSMVLDKTAELGDLKILKSLREFSGRISQFNENSVELSPYTTSVEVRGDTMAPLLNQLQHIVYLMSNNIPGSGHHYQSIKSTDIEMLKTLLRHTGSPASLTVKAIVLQVFQIALQTGDLALVQVLQDIGTNMNSIVHTLDKTDAKRPCMTALQAVVSKPVFESPHNSEVVLRFLLQNGADPNTCGRTHNRNHADHKTSHVVYNVYLNADEILSDSDDASSDSDDASSDVNDAHIGVCNVTKCSKGYTCCSALPLGMLLHDDEPEKLQSRMLEALIEVGAHVCERLDLTSLIQSGYSNNTMTRLLLKHGAAPSVSACRSLGRASYHWSPLQAAIAGRDIELAGELINLGATLELTSEEILRNTVSDRLLEPRSILTLALLTDLDLAKKLIEKGAPINECHFHYDDMDDVEMEYFLTSKFDLSSTHDQILSIGFGNGLALKHGRIVYVSIDDNFYEAEYEKIDKLAGYAFSPLQAAIASKSIEMVEAVLSAGGSLQCCHGTPPLVIAVRTRQPEIVRRLIALGVDINKATLDLDSRLWLLSPLAEAAARNDLEIMSMLVAVGADVDHCDARRGLTALQTAIMCKAYDSVQYLMEHCAPDLLHKGSFYGTDALSATVQIDDIRLFNLLISCTSSKPIPEMLLLRVLPLAIAAVNKEYTASLLTTNIDIQAPSVIKACVATIAGFDWLQKVGFDLKLKVSGRSLGDEAFGFALNIDGLWNLTRDQVAQRMRIGYTIIERGGSVSSTTFEKLLVNFADGCVRKMKDDADNIVAIEDIINVYCASQAWNLTTGVFKRLVPFILHLSPSYCQSLVENLIRVDFDLNSGCCCSIKKGGQGNDGRFVTYLNLDEVSLTPLQAAASRQNVQAVDLLLRHGATPNPPNAQKKGLTWPTALQLSVQYLNLPLFQLLIDFGADVNAEAKAYLYPVVYGYRWVLECTSHSLLGLAIHSHYRDSRDVDTRLGEHFGLPTNAIPFRKRDSVTELAATYNLVNLLLKSGANVNARASCRGESALQIAAAESDVSIVQALIARGADVNAAASTQKHGKTALQAACEQKDLDTMKVLLENGAHINSPAGLNYGATALQYAAMNGHFQMVQILLAAGADVAAPASAKGGRTAINGAAEHARLDIVKFLLDHYKGTVPMSTICRQASGYAQRRGHTVVVELLQEYELSTFVNMSPTP